MDSNSKKDTPNKCSRKRTNSVEKKVTTSKVTRSTSQSKCQNDEKENILCDLKNEIKAKNGIHPDAAQPDEQQQCSICNDSFPNKSAMDNHIIIVTKHAKKVCELCDNNEK